MLMTVVWCSSLREADGKVIIDNAVDFNIGETIDYRYNQ